MALAVAAMSGFYGFARPCRCLENKLEKLSHFEPFLWRSEAKKYRYVK